MTRKNSLRGRVIRRWEKAGKPNWSLKKTISICIIVERELTKAGFNRTPKFSRSIREKNQQYIRKWVRGCHFEWINPR